LKCRVLMYFYPRTSFTIFGIYDWRWYLHHIQAFYEMPPQRLY
jgi:hypothetical protein